VGWGRRGGVDWLGPPPARCLPDAFSFFSNLSPPIHHTHQSQQQGQPARRARNAFLKDNFAPIEAETHVTDLAPTHGALPPALDGAFARIGPNPEPARITGDYHWFDGDGCVHAVRIKGGKASYASHFVRTARRAAEEGAGHALYTKFGDHRGGWALAHMALGALRRLTGARPGRDAGEGTANTALEFLAGRLLALHEGDLPYALQILCDGLVETLGRARLAAPPADGKGAASAAPTKPLTSLTAHPKKDADGFYAISYRLDAQPFVRYVGLDPATGSVVWDTPVHTRGPVMMHDFAITQHHAILLDVPLVFTPEKMVGSGSSMPFTFDKARGTRFGVMPKRGGCADPVWCELDGPGVMIFHVANAHAVDEHTILLYACAFDDFDLDLDGKLAREARVEGAPDHYARLCEIRLDTRTRTATRRPLCPFPGDFPRVPAALVGREARFAYVATMDPASPVPLFTGVAKVDLKKAGAPAKAVAGHIQHGPHRYGGECAFVPDPARKGEDAGFLVTYVHDESPAARAASPDGRGVSELVVYDAQKMGGTPVARVPLPARVPYGFHVHHMNEAEFRSQVGRPWGVDGGDGGGVVAREE
jgi:carotenoid 9,10(9',10')-cleavage dioxygenase 1